MGSFGELSTPEPLSELASRLVNTIALAHLSSEAVLEILRDTDTHPRLLGFVRRAQTLRSILSFSFSGKYLRDATPTLGHWIPVLDYIAQKPDELASSLGLVGVTADDFRSDTGSDPIMGLEDGTKKHGLQPLLWVRSRRPSDDPLTARLILLQGQMLLAHVSILRFEFKHSLSSGKRRPDHEVFDSLYNPTKYARFFAREAWTVALSKLPMVIDRREYYRRLDEARAQVMEPNGEGEEKNCTRTDVYKAFTSILGFLDRGLDPGGYRKKKFSKRQKADEDSGGIGEIQTSTIEIGDPEDPSADAQNIEIVSRWTGTKKDRQALIDAGEDPADFLLKHRLILVASGAAGSSVTGALEKANQLLPWSYDELHPLEYLRVRTAMRTIRDSIGSEIDALELCAWTDTIAWTSCSPDQATNLRVGVHGAPSPDCDLCLSLPARGKTRSQSVPFFRIRVIEPEYRTEDDPIEGLERRRKKHFNIQEFGWASSSISELLSHLRSLPLNAGFDERSLQVMPVKIFSRDTAWYRTAFNGFVKLLGESDRITIPRLRRVLFQSIYDSSMGDIVSSAVVTANDHYLASVRKSYSTFSVSHLRRVHKGGAELVIAGLKDAGSDELGISGLPLEVDEDSTGSRGCPTVNQFRKKVEFLESLVERNVPLNTEAKRQREFQTKHDGITLLSVWATGVSVGMRAINTPYLHSSEYDHETLMGTFTDKALSIRSNFRFFRIAKVAHLLAINYESYLEKLRDIGLPPSTKSLPCYFVSLSESGFLPITVSPSSVRERFGNFFPLAPNFARRLVRTEAIERGIGSIYVDAYCGHGFRGEESFNKFSAFNPIRYFDEMGAVVDAILKELKFRPVTLEPIL